MRRRTALVKPVILLVDVINDLSFPGGEAFLPSFTKMSRVLPELLAKARRKSIPIVYVNDNWGKWQSDRSKLIRHMTRELSPNRNNILPILPEKNDVFVLKPMHSAFYACPTDLILQDLGAKTLIICGVSAESCILFTATDAHLRHYRVVLPTDCLVSESPTALHSALDIMQRSLKAEVLPSRELSFMRNSSPKTSSSLA